MTQRALRSTLRAAGRPVMMFRATALVALAIVSCGGHVAVSSDDAAPTPADAGRPDLDGAVQDTYAAPLGDAADDAADDADDEGAADASTDGPCRTTCWLYRDQDAGAEGGFGIAAKDSCCVPKETCTACWRDAGCGLRGLCLAP